MEAGKPLELRLDCLEPRRVGLAAVEIPEGTYDWTKIETEIDNPAPSCRYGRIYLSGNSVRGSFNTRYSGKIERPAG